MLSHIKSIQSSEKVLLDDLSQLIEQSNNSIIVQANSVMSMLFWNDSKRINKDIQQNNRENNSKQIFATVATFKLNLWK